MVLGQAYSVVYQVADFFPTSVFKFYITVSAWGSMVLKAAEKSEQAPGGSGEGSSVLAMELGLGWEELWGCSLGSLNRGLKSSISLEVVPLCCWGRWSRETQVAATGGGVTSVSPKHTYPKPSLHRPHF